MEKEEKKEKCTNETGSSLTNKPKSRLMTSLTIMEIYLKKHGTMENQGTLISNKERMNSLYTRQPGSISREID